MFLKNKIKQESVDILPEFNSNKNFMSINKPLQKVVRDILVILSTRKNSLIYQPGKGSILYDSLWDNITTGLIERLKIDIETNIARSSNLVLKKLNIENTDNKSINIDIILNVNYSTDLQVIADLNEKGYLTLEKATEIITETIIVQS